MLLIVVLGVASILCLAVGIVVDKYSRLSDGFGWKICSIIFAVLFTLSLIFALHTELTKDAYIASNEQRYNSLVYQLENNIYDNDNDIGKKELMKEIQDWNECLAKGKIMKDNKWVGVYYPDELFEHFDFIELE